MTLLPQQRPAQSSTGRVDLVKDAALAEQEPGEVATVMDLEVIPTRSRRRVINATATVFRAAGDTIPARRAVAAACTGWHITRQLPRTTFKLISYSPRGLGRATLAWARYLHDHDSAELRSHHAGKRETAEYVKIANVRSENLTARLMVNGTLAAVALAVALAWTAPTALGVLLGSVVFVWTVKLIPGRKMGELFIAFGLGVITYYLAPWLAHFVPPPPWWAWWSVSALLVLVLGWVGRPKQRPLVFLPDGSQVPPLTAPIVTRALCTLGNSKMKEPDDIRLLSDPHRHGPGVQVDVELPEGVTATYVMDKREEFAAALRRELGTVWPSVGPRHPGHLVVFASDQPMSKASQRPWPLLRDGTVDLFRPFPAFTDQRGQWVDVTLAYANMIVGAIPRMGKTFVVRELLLCAGLDPRAQVYAIDGKGTGDLAPCAAFAHFYSVGDEPEEVDRVLHAMRGLRQEMRRRTRIIRELPRDKAPENKVTSELASIRSLRLEPIVVGIDETQVYFEDAPKDVRDELISLVTDLVKRGPALGIVVILATQSVTKYTIPTGISNNAVLRFCLKMEGHEQNDKVLGTGAYKRGIDAQMFDIDDKGIGYLRAEGTAPVIARSVFGLDAVASEKVALRARQLRAATGRLTGEQVEELAVPERDIRADVEQQMANHARRSAHLVELVEWLRGEFSEYRDLDVEELGVRLRNRGITTSQVKVANRNLQGVDLRKQGGKGGDDPVDLD